MQCPEVVRKNGMVDLQAKKIESVGHANKHFDLAFLQILTTGKNNFVELGPLPRFCQSLD